MPPRMFQLIHGHSPVLAPQELSDIGPLSFTGVSRDSTGVALGGCTVKLYRTINDTLVETTVSDGSGNYSFSKVSLSDTYYVVAYKAGVPPVAGTTKNNLVGV